MGKSSSRLYRKLSQLIQNFKIHLEKRRKASNADISDDAVNDYRFSLVEHSLDKTTVCFEGLYRTMKNNVTKDTPVHHFYNEETNMNCMYQIPVKEGEPAPFISAWTLNRKQKEELLYTHNLTIKIREKRKGK